jgi:hypothetical protein
MRHEWGARAGPLVLSNREMSKDSSKNIEIKAKLRLPLQMHTFWRRCQTSQQHTTLRTFLVCIINPLITILAKINRTSAFSEGNSKAQVHRRPSTWNLKSGAVSCYMCWPTLTKWSRTWGKFSTSLFNTLSLFCIQLPCFSLVQGICSSLLESIKGSYPVGIWYPS